MRVLRIELRRSLAPWALLILAVTGGFLLYASNEPYPSWLGMVLTQRDIMQLTWPLALAAGAWQGIRERRSGVEELMGTTARPRWQRVLPVSFALAFAVFAAYVAAFASATGHLRHIDSYLSYGVVPIIALGGLGFVAAAWLGLAIGRLLPSPLTAPILVVLGFGVLALMPALVFGQHADRSGAVLLLPTLRDPDLGVVSVMSWRANLVQALWLGAVALTGLMLFAFNGIARVAALLPLVVGAAVTVPALPDTFSAAWVEDRRATQIVCTSGVPPICITRMQSYLLGELREPVRETLAVLAAKLPPAPQRVLVLIADKSPDVPAPADTLVIRLLLDQEYTSADLRSQLQDGAGVRECSALSGGPDSPSDMVMRYLGARIAVKDWLLGRPAEPPAQKADGTEESYAYDALKVLNTLPVVEQRMRVEAYRAAERACAPGDRIAVLAPELSTR
jgi:hypothetical protein